MTAPYAIQAQAELERRRRAGGGAGRWPSTYVNRDTGRPYQPHHADEARFVAEDGPWRYGLAKGGEGGGKSVAGIIKVLERLRRGMNGIMVGTDLEHFKKSLWPEFRRWCPWDQVVPGQRRRAAPAWEPQHSFSLAFTNGTVLLCGGIDDPASWEGPNVSFAHFDEARRKKTADALKVLDGRVRIPGPAGEPPQLFLTTTPRKHWLFEYFGPLLEADDPRASFKASAFVIDLLTRDNAANLAEGYVEDRAKTLTAAEARVLLEAAWEDIDAADRFLASMLWWDACKEDLPPLDPREPMVLCADGGVSSDHFALVGVTRHPARRADPAIRYVEAWTPPRGGKLDFALPEAEIRRLCAAFHVVALVYDPYQLHDMMTRLQNEGVVWTWEFNQGADRLVADKQLYDLILGKRMAHDGNPILRAAIDNADRKIDGEDRKIRIVKRSGDLKIDPAVAASMGVARCLELNL
jgi:hypothetical protein